MNSYQIGFKENLLNTVFKVTSDIWLKVTGAYLISMLAVFGVAFVGVLLIGAEEIVNTLTSAGGVSDMSAIAEELEAAMTAFMSPIMFVVLFIFIITMLVVSSWHYYFSFLITDMQIKGNEVILNKALNLSMKSTVFKLIGVVILFYIIMLFGMGVAVGLGQMLGMGAMFLLYVVVFILMYRFVLVVPAIAIGNQSLGEAFSFSFEHITWGRALKLFGATILFVIAAGVGGSFIMLASALFMFIPVIGAIIQLVIQFAFTGLMTAFFVASMAGLYYRYSEDMLVDDDSFDRHLMEE